MCHHTAEEWEEVVRTLVEEEPEEEFRTERGEGEEAAEKNEKPVPADD